jgi:protein-disulfide isomerase
MRELSMRWTRAGLVLALAAGLGISGCKKKTDGGSAPAASGSAAAGAPSGPCEQYATQLCDKAGKESETCKAITTTTGLMPPAACTAALKDVAFSVKKLGDQRKACDELIAKLCKEFGEKTDICTMVTTQTKQFPPDRCAMMQQHYGEIVADLKRMQGQNQPLSAEQQALLGKAPAPSFGPADAKVTVVEFSDFECPYCSKAADVVTQVKKKYGDRVRFVFRQFPLSFHPNAKEAAEASLAAHAQGKFWQFHDKLFQNQQQLDRASLEKHAKEAGLNVVSFKKALDSDEFAAQVDADLKLGEQVQVNGTPTLFVNGARVDNPTSVETVSAAIDKALGSPPG